MPKKYIRLLIIVIVVVVILLSLFYYTASVAKNKKYYEYTNNILETSNISFGLEYNLKKTAEICIQQYLTYITEGKSDEAYNTIYSDYRSALNITKGKYIKMQKEIFANKMYRFTDIQAKNNDTYVITVAILNEETEAVENTYKYIISINIKNTEFAVLYDGAIESKR